MRIDLANIAGTPGARGRWTVSVNPPATEDYETAGPVEGWLEVENTGSLLLVTGELRGIVRVKCVRCLGECVCPLTARIEEQFATAETAPDVLTIDRDDPEASAIKDFVLDVSEMVRQQLAVNLPMRQLCREDCQGICPVCGENLNVGGCSCTPAPADARWSILANKLGQVKGEK